MVPIRWRLTIGPAIAIATAGLILVSDQYLFRGPNSGAIAFLALALSAYLGGIGAGLTSAAILVVLAAVHFSLPGAFLHFTPDNLQRMLVLIVCTPAIAVMIGIQQARMDEALQRERLASGELKPLRAALDQSEIGILLLDSDLRAQFTNRAFRRLWRLPDALADRKPSFVDLMTRGGDRKNYVVPADKIESYIAERAALVRAGDERPVDIRLATGDVIRSRCKVLADGGRMLTYGNVSDLVRSADEFAELAMTDPLTGISNRRHFMARLESEWKRYRRYGRPLSLLMLDIDHFKSINDRFGHDMGDRIIVEVAKLCGLQTRDSDVAARVGGEEFAILLPETDLKDALIVAERLRKSVAERPVQGGEQNVAVAVSIGAAFAGANTADAATFMKDADEALYAAKRGGRNRVAAKRDDGPAIIGQQAETPAAA